MGIPLASLFQDDTEERGSSLDFSGVKIEPPVRKSGGFRDLLEERF